LCLTLTKAYLNGMFMIHHIFLNSPNHFLAVSIDYSKIILGDLDFRNI
jgi:hypothetical protein